MTAEAPEGLSAQLAGLPAWTLDEGQLGDVELLLSGVFAPLRGFMTAAEVTSVTAHGMLPDGTPWPVPVTLEVPAMSLKPDETRLLLQDPEGTPLAVLDITERLAIDPEPDFAAAAGAEGRHRRPAGAGGVVRLSGPLTQYRPPEHGPFRQLRRPPADVRAELAGGPVLGYVTRGPLHCHQIGQLRHAASQLKARLLILPLIAGPAEVVTRPDALVRTVRAAARSLPPATLVIPVPLRPYHAGARDDLALRAAVAAAYGATHLLGETPAERGAALRDGTRPGPVIPVISPGDWAYDPAAEVWRPLALIEAGTERADLSTGELEDLLDRGGDVPAWFTPPAVARELRRARPPRGERGLVVFLTGLSGSGKSTLARALRDALSEQGDRTVSLLDGDLVRALLSAGLTFSRADRDLNIARIGYVAAEIARHGGIAICAPIAPYAQARSEVRRAVQEVGDFLLIYVSTPAEVCEARDRKGLYAKARAGLIDHFTGVSDPYEEPDDADLVIDTSVMTPPDALQAVLHLLTEGGWLTEAPA